MGGDRNLDIQKTQQDLPVHEKWVSNLVGSYLDKATELGDKVEKAANDAAASTVENSSAARKALVTVEGAGYALPALGTAAWHNLTNPGELLPKVATAAAFGIGMRLLFPEAGAAKALVGTAYSLSFLREAYQPFKQAFNAVDAGGDMNSVNQTAQHLGSGLGEFGVDTAIGIGFAKVGEIGTGAALKQGLGPEKYTKFESAKNYFWNSDKMPVGWTLNNVARGADWMFGGLGSKLMKPHEFKEIPLEEQLAKIKQTSERAHKSVEDGGFYKYGKRLEDGKRVNFSRYLDMLEEGKDPNDPSLAVAAEKPVKLTLEPAKPKSHIPADASESPAEGEAAKGTAAPRGIFSKLDLTDPEGIRAPKKRPIDPTVEVEDKPASDRLPVTGTAKQEYSAATISSMAKRARAVMESWDDEHVQIADYKDQFDTPIGSISDTTRKGAMVGPEYQPSSTQLRNLIQQLNSKGDLEQAGLLLDHHARAAMGIERSEANHLALNMQAREFHGSFLQGLRSAGISDKVLSGKVPSLVAITNDGGAGNFTEPAIPGVVERPVTVWPRNQTGLIGVFADINGHEEMGHDYTYQDILRFAKEFRTQLVSDIVDRAFKGAGIEDEALTANGTGSKKEWFTKLLIAEANENTADIMGTAKTGSGTPVSLSVLLMALRDGGMLETRDVYGKRFALPDEEGGAAVGTDKGIEPHGIDRWRLRLCAEVIRQLSLGNKAPAGPEYDAAKMKTLLDKYGDPDLMNKANALEELAKDGSRKTDSYVWANEDKPGEKVTISQKEWDAVIPYLVKAQLDTPLDALEGKTFRDTIRDFKERQQRVDVLAGLITDSVHAGSDKLTAPFDKTQFSMSEVLSAGLRAWQMAKASGEDAARSHALIESISANLRQQYLDGNPHEVPLTRSPLRLVASRPVTAMKEMASSAVDATGRALQWQTRLRELSARYATPMAGAAGSTMMNEIIQYQRMKKKMEEAAANK